MSVLNRSIVSSIFKSFEGESVAVAKARATQDAAIQKAIDASRSL